QLLDELTRVRAPLVRGRGRRACARTATTGDEHESGDEERTPHAPRLLPLRRLAQRGDDVCGVVRRDDQAPVLRSVELHHDRGTAAVDGREVLSLPRSKRAEGDDA